jgi:hypothetical protein
MTDVAPIEENMPLVPPAREATAELEPLVPPVADASIEASTDAPASAEVSEPVAERALPFEIEHAIGATRQRILDEFLDADRAELSMSELKALLADVLPGTVEACVRREWQQGRLLRISPGHYALAPAQPAKPAPPPEPEQVHSEQWFAWLDEWKVEGEWKGPGAPPGQDGCEVPADIVAKFVDRVRKRLERQRDRESALAKQAEADAALRARLIEACHGNIVLGPGIEDVSCIRAAMDLVDLDTILFAIRGKVDLCLPTPPPVKQWNETRLLEAIAKLYCRHLARRLVAVWSQAAQKSASASEPSPAVEVLPEPEKRIHGVPAEREQPFWR